jgi:hypothetical protein
MQVPFEDIALPEIALLMELSKASLGVKLALLSRELRRALPEETTTSYHLLAQEFMRRQDAILAATPAPAAENPRGSIASYLFFVRGPRKLSAKA